MLKNDVWVSLDQGKTWIMANPGCDPHVLQRSQMPVWSTSLALQRNTQKSNGAIYEATAQKEILPTSHGTCLHDDDCYGSASCFWGATGSNERGACVSEMWSPRQLHRAVAHQGFIYVVGGFSSTPNGKCGEFACGGGVRVAMSDVWRADLSGPWVNLAWVEVKPHEVSPSAWAPRGSFGLVVMNFHSSSGGVRTGEPCLWILGGEGQGQPQTFYNDVWGIAFGDMSSMSSELWFREKSTTPWAPRAGFVAAVEPASVETNGLERIVIHGAFLSFSLSIYLSIYLSRSI